MSKARVSQEQFLKLQETLQEIRKEYGYVITISPDFVNIQEENTIKPLDHIHQNLSDIQEKN